MPDSTGAGDASLPRDITRQMVSKTQFAITGEDTRYFLNGALLVLRPKEMSMVATDGHRLALVTAPRDGGAGAPDELRVIVQKKTLLELGRLLGEAGDEVTFEKGENHLFFRFADRVLVSRMIDGQFPAYERVIPKGNDKAVEFDRDRLTNAVKRVALLANERSRSVKFQIDPNEVTVTSNSSEFGEAKEVIPVEYSGPSVTICFNAQYVLDFLSVAETDIVVLQFKDEMSQAVLKPVGASGYDYTYVIMPMRI
jgi:DNA polymerase III subunit beta